MRARRSSCRLGLAVALGLAPAGCTTITVEPEPTALPSIPAAERQPLDFDLHYAVGPPRSRPSADPSTPGLDGEDLAIEAAAVRALLEDTHAFVGVARGRPGRRLHCDLRIGAAVDAGAQVIILFLSLGTLPCTLEDAYEVVAVVSAPGRAPQTYTFHSSSHSFVWLPLLPIGLVQVCTQSGARTQAVDALVAQMAADGWLGPNGDMRARAR